MVDPKIFREEIDKMYPQKMVHLHYDPKKPWTMLFAVILSAQCTDARVNAVTPRLFADFPNLEAFANAEVGEIRESMASISFCNAKAKHLRGSARRLLLDFGGKVPQEMNALITLPGVGRKTANVVAHVLYGLNLGFVVDTHIKRIAYRTGQTRHTDPVKVEKDMKKLHPRQSWGDLAHKLVQFGRDVCPARSPGCETCPFKQICPRRGVKKSF